GDEQGGRAEAASAICASRRLIGRGNRSHRWRNVVEEAAPFVEIDDEDRAAPRGALRDGRIDTVHHRLASADVAVRVVVRARTGQLLQETPVDEGDSGERPQGAVSVERVDRATDGQVLAAPQPQERQVGVVVPAYEAPGGQPVPDGRQLRDG